VKHVAFMRVLRTSHVETASACYLVAVTPPVLDFHQIWYSGTLQKVAGWAYA
jgi:hypothetical protein